MNPNNERSAENSADILLRLANGGRPTSAIYDAASGHFNLKNIVQT